MSKFFGREELYEQIQKLADQSQNMKFAVAFWGKGASEFIKTLQFGELKIIVNLLSGATNPDEIEAIKKIKGVKMRHNLNLHSKVYWTENGAIVGSSNLSSNGMRFEGVELDGWIESNFLTKSKRENDKINQWFEGIWSQSSPVKPEDIEKAKKLRDKVPPPPRGSLLENLKRYPAQFKKKEIYFALYNSCEVPPEVEELYENEDFSDDHQDYSYYWDWDLTPGAYFLNVCRDNKDKSTEQDGLWQILDRPKREGKKMEHQITLCRRTDSAYGFKFTKDDEEIIQNKADELCKKYLPKKDEAFYISLYKVRKILFS